MRATLLLLVLAGCNRGGVKIDDTADTLDIGDAEDVQDACEDRVEDIEIETFLVTFDGTSGGCPWGQDGNIDPEQGFLTARVEQEETLDLSEVVICDMDFDFAGDAGLEQDIVYDDNFLFTFNGVVLAASYRPWVDALAADGIFRIYDWDSIVGMENLFDDGIPTYCVGEDSELADCDIPPPETQGPISLSFDLAITSELSYRAIDESRVEFGFIATGDNDPDVDCSHEPFFFEVTVPYLP